MRPQRKSGKRQFVISFLFSTKLLSLYLHVSSLQHSFMKGWVEVSFTQQRKYLFLMDSSEIGLCYEACEIPT